MSDLPFWCPQSYTHHDSAAPHSANGRGFGSTIAATDRLIRTATAALAVGQTTGRTALAGLTTAVPARGPTARPCPAQAFRDPGLTFSSGSPARNSHRHVIALSQHYHQRLRYRCPSLPFVHEWHREMHAIATFSCPTLCRPGRVLGSAAFTQPRANAEKCGKTWARVRAT